MGECASVRAEPGLSLLEFLNREAEELLRLSNLPKDVLRGHLRDRLAEAYAFPREFDGRFLVVGSRVLSLPPEWLGEGVEAAERRFLELVPEGLTREAAALSGPVVVAWSRALMEGSVVSGRFRLEDPRARTLEVPGLLASLVDARVEVAVEP